MQEFIAVGLHQLQKELFMQSPGKIRIHREISEIWDGSWGCDALSKGDSPGCF